MMEARSMSLSSADMCTERATASRLACFGFWHAQELGVWYELEDK